MNEFQAMLLSVLIEGPIAVALVRLTRWPCRGPAHAGLTLCVATAVTHPQFWAAFPWLMDHLGYDGAMVTGEAVVVVVEAAILVWAIGLSACRALLLSFCANGTSAIIGLFVLS